MNVAALEQAYDKAVCAFLNAVPSASEEQAEACIEAICEMVLATLASQLTEEAHATDNH
jgi:hypothetical protein